MHHVLFSLRMIVDSPRMFCIRVGAIILMLMIASSTTFGDTAVLMADGSVKTPSPVKEDTVKEQPVIVVGFVGGFIKHDNPVHSEVQLAARLRKDYSPGVQVETFENHHGERALKTVLLLLDSNKDGTLSPEEKQHARIIIYGHSWGGSECITLARDLGKQGIPVLLTIQVDSVSKIHQDDEVIPANVAKAANFYQPNGLLHGRSTIRAADPTRTNIIGNFRFDYKTVSYKCHKYPWYNRILSKSHTQIECDPVVWSKAEALIRSDLPHLAASRPER
jgi:hypothetical protein